MGSILIIDDNEAFLQLLQDYVRQHHPSLTVMTCNDPIKCLARISTDLDLLLVDLEMPGLDGSKVLAYATAKGWTRTASSSFPPTTQTTCTGGSRWGAASLS